MTRFDRTQVANSSVAFTTRPRDTGAVVDLIGQHAPAVVDQLLGYLRRSSNGGITDILGNNQLRHTVADALKPAAIRLERTVGHDHGHHEQTAMTVWFGEGPSLPSPKADRGAGGRSGLREISLQVAGTLAIGAATIALAEWERRRRTLVIDQEQPNRISSPVERLGRTLAQGLAVTSVARRS